MLQNCFKISHPQKLVPKKFPNNFFFKTQYASDIGKVLNAGNLPESIEVLSRISGLEALRVSLVVKLYDFLMREW